MKIEIWSDVMCPFCYIGKRQFEKALQQFERKDEVEITWKSFRLNPAMKTDPQKNINQYLAEIKGWTIDHAKSLNDRVTQMAAGVGLKYDFDKAVVANSSNAHRLIQLAKKHHTADLVEENLFNAYFTLGKNIDDIDTLIQIGIAAGIDAVEVKTVLASASLSDEVEADEQEAREIGVTGVPFFVADRKFAISGAQPAEAFLEFLRKSSV
jgi:predicted DsbA family dithiol-disulfide isomerase